MGNNGIVFMGTPEFAAVCLQKLVESGLNVVAVVTMPDKAKGRGLKVKYSPVKDYAINQNIPVLQPTNLKDSTFLEELRSYNHILQIVVAFRMLPKEVWNMPKYGTFNLHASLLPKYRGAAPIQWAIWNGEKESGVSTFILNEDIDTGDIIYQEKVKIEEDENAGSLHDKLLEIGSALIIKTTKDIFAGKIKSFKQDVNKDTVLPLAPKIFKKDCYISFNKSAIDVCRQIRALSPYPSAIACLNCIDNNKILPIKIFKCKKIDRQAKGYKAGEIISDNKTFLEVVCANEEVISIKEAQLPDRKKLPIEELLRGFDLKALGNIIFIDFQDIDK